MTGTGAPTLRPYQKDFIQAIATGADNGLSRVLCKAATGLGKTVCIAAMPEWPGLRDRLARWKKTGPRMLVIAHREELLDQAAEKIHKANPHLMVSIEQGERRASRFSDVIVASIQTLSAMRFRRLRRMVEMYGHIPLVVIDEAHHAAAASYRTALVHLGFLPKCEASEDEEIEAADFDDVAEMEKALATWDKVAPKDRLLVGVTATPNRSDAIGLGCVFQSIVYSYALKDAIDDKYLVPIRPWVVETDASLDSCRMSHGDFNQKDLAEAVNTAQRNKLAVAAWHEYAPGLPTIGFTVDVAHAHSLAAEFQSQGVRAAAISGETPKEERRDILREYREQRIDVILNCMVLTEGTDLPLTRCILHAKPTKSATLYTQMTGRGLRIHPGKEECIVIDLVDVARRHSLQAAPVLYGLPPGVNTKGEDLAQLSDEIEAFREKHPNFDLEAALAAGRYSLKDLEARASTFDIWTVPTLGAMATVVKMNWIFSSDGTYRLSYPWLDGMEALTVQKDMLGHFEVVATFRPRALPGEPPAVVRQRTIAAQITEAAAALSLAEAYIRQERSSVSRLTDRSAPWRDGPASTGQIGYLRKLRVPFDPKSLTKGKASDLINMAKARQGK